MEQDGIDKFEPDRTLRPYLIEATVAGFDSLVRSIEGLASFLS